MEDIILLVVLDWANRFRWEFERGKTHWGGVNSKRRGKGGGKKKTNHKKMRGKSLNLFLNHTCSLKEVKHIKKETEVQKNEKEKVQGKGEELVKELLGLPYRKQAWVWSHKPKVTDLTGTTEFLGSAVQRR